MRKNKLQAANLQGTAADIEAAFYEALQTGDIDKLMACWADEDEIVCIHPGGPRVIGAGAIRASFEAIRPRHHSRLAGAGAQDRVAGQRGAQPAGTGRGRLG